MLIATSTADLITDLDHLRGTSNEQSGPRKSVSLVVTSGDLHAGPRSVIKAAHSASDVVVVAITPNPHMAHRNLVATAQFKDTSLVDQARIDLLFVPSEQEFLHQQLPSAFSLRLPQGYPIDLDKNYLEQTLTLNLSFYNIVNPDVIVYGERKYIEYRLLRQLVTDLSIRAQVHCLSTVRAGDGLALCSNNGKLTVSERSRAPILYQTLNNVIHALRTGARTFEKLKTSARIALKRAGFHIDSFAIYDDANLSAAQADTHEFRIIGDTLLGSHRLHDNMGIRL